MDTQNSLTILLQKKTPYSEVMNILPNVSKVTISRYNKRFFDGANPTHIGKRIESPKKLSYTTPIVFETIK